MTGRQRIVEYFVEVFFFWFFGNVAGDLVAKGFVCL